MSSEPEIGISSKLDISRQLDVGQDAEKKQKSSLFEAIMTWFDYWDAANDLVHLTYEGLTQIQDMPKVWRILEAEEDIQKRTEWKAEKAKIEIDAGYPTLHAHTLLGLCGALECFVEDIFMATIKGNPDILQGEKFNKIRIPVSLLAGTDENTRFRAIVTEVTRSTSSDIAVGINKYEKLLKLIDLDGPVPEAVKVSIFRSQQIRNIWAHRGGIADQRFVENCSDLGYDVGDKVCISSDEFHHLIHGMRMYAVVVINRKLDRLGHQRLDTDSPGYEGCLAEVPMLQA